MIVSQVFGIVMIRGDLVGAAGKFLSDQSGLAVEGTGIRHEGDLGRTV